MRGKEKKNGKEFVGMPHDELKGYNTLKRMKTEKIGRFVVLVCFSFLVLSFFSCRIRRQIAGSVRSDRTDSLSLTHADSLWASRLEHLSGHTRFQWRHILLSPPDSAGIQYPVSVSDARLDRREEDVRQDSVRRFTRLESSARKQEKKEEKQRRLHENTTSSFPLTAVLFGTDLLLLGIIIRMVWRRKSGKK